MGPYPEAAEFELIYVIVNRGLGSKVLHIAKNSGISGGAIFLGKGTINNRFLEMLALCDIQKEIVMIVANKAICLHFIEMLNRELKLNKPNHGIAYSIPVMGICGSRSYNCKNLNELGGIENTMYQSIIVIVDKGKGEAVVEAATQAGSKGATIINARGSGIHETSKLFAMEIEPEKEIVLMITKSEQTNEIVSSIHEKFQIDKPGNGIIFIQNISQTYGLYES